jgi:hypothetical protein
MPTHAQQSASDDREAIKQLLKRVEQLEARIKELESRQVDISPAATDIAAKQSEPRQSTDLHASHDSTPAGSPLLQLRGFADVNFRASDEKGVTQSFALGQIDLFITSRLSERFSALAELVIESDDDNEFGFEAERLLLQYTHSDYFKLAAGRYHSSIGYYNTAFHHGTWFQTAIGRPFIFEFEDDGGILPIHNVGLTATGRIPAGGLGLNYVAEMGNGRAHRTPLSEAVQIAVDENNGKSFNIGAFARPDSLPGFQAGFSVYRDHLTPEGGPNINETIFAGHVVYQNNEWEILHEGVVVRHALRGSNTTFNTPGFYSQFSRRFGRSRPYFRYEYVNAPSGDPILFDVGRLNGPSVGFRFDLSEFVAFKTQYDRLGRRGLDSINKLGLQLAFTF